MGKRGAKGKGTLAQCEFNFFGFFGGKFYCFVQILDMEK